LLRERTERSLWRHTSASRNLAAEPRNSGTRDARHCMDERPRCAISKERSRHICDAACKLWGNTADLAGTNPTEQLPASLTNEPAADFFRCHPTELFGSESHQLWHDKFRG